MRIPHNNKSMENKSTVTNKCYRLKWYKLETVHSLIYSESTDKVQNDDGFKRTNTRKSI